MSDFIPTLPEYIDSSMRGTFVACPMQYYWTYYRRLIPRVSSVHLHFGGVLAAAFDTARRAFGEQGLPEADAEAEGLRALLTEWGDFESPEGSPKTLERAIEVYEMYWDRWPLSGDLKLLAVSDGRVGSELRFSVPLPVIHPETDQPIFFVGKCDAVGTYQGVQVVIDEKTMGSMGAGWASKFDMRAQFSGYCWAMRQHGLRPMGVLVRGIGILKSETRLSEILIPRSEWDIEEWHAQMVRDVTRLVEAYKSDVWDKSLDLACTSYGGCAYANLCRRPNPEPYTDDYTFNAWDPRK